MTGTVLTFYSYKGGVGRSFALANVALLLARWGKRVLCLDWDLEAPGLLDYFRPHLGGEPAGGIVNLVEDFRAGRCQPSAHRTPLIGVGALDVVAADRETPGYPRRVQDIDWELLYDQGFGDYLEKCREQWTADYDYVLIDSRTGISDVGGICTAHLPDRLVVLFTANQQSVAGAADIAVRAGEARDRMPFDRSQLIVMPVLSRFDNREEYEEAENWRKRCARETRGLFRNWLDMRVEPELMARHLTLPYVSHWSFGERLPVLSEPVPASDQISFALETLAAVIAHDFDRTDLLAENRDAYVTAVRERRDEFAYEFLVSTQRSTKDRAAVLVDELRRLGVSAKMSLSGAPSMLGHGGDDARHLCLLVDHDILRWQSAEAELFLHRTLGQNRRLIPVLTRSTAPARLPGYVGNLRHLWLGDPAVTARELVAQLDGGSPAEVAEPDVPDVLEQVRHALLSPSMWTPVKELLGQLERAAVQGRPGATDEFRKTLAFIVRPGRPEPFGTGAPPDVRLAIERAANAHQAQVPATGKEIG